MSKKLDFHERKRIAFYESLKKDIKEKNLTKEQKQCLKREIRKENIRQCWQTIKEHNVLLSAILGLVVGLLYVLAAANGCCNNEHNGHYDNDRVDSYTSTFHHAHTF